MAPISKYIRKLTHNQYYKDIKFHPDHFETTPTAKLWARYMPFVNKRRYSILAVNRGMTAFITHTNFKSHLYSLPTQIIFAVCAFIHSYLIVTPSPRWQRKVGGYFTDINDNEAKIYWLLFFNCGFVTKCQRSIYQTFFIKANTFFSDTTIYSRTTASVKEYFVSIFYCVNDTKICLIDQVPRLAQYKCWKQIL